jgi:hypothetical protein
MTSHQSLLGSQSKSVEREGLANDRNLLKMYEAFMVGYVRRLNEATFNVTIGGVRIGSAKQTRLAQINLKTRIITFSRFAVENVPERGRRYLVLHELAHVKEPSHNREFWHQVGLWEPNYKQVGRALELAFKRNVKEDSLKSGFAQNAKTGKIEIPKLLLSDPLAYNAPPEENLDFSVVDDENEVYQCMEDEFSKFDDGHEGTIYGGSEFVSGVDLTAIS